MLRDTSDIQACLAKGNEASKPIDDRRYDLAQNWNPSEYYEPAAIRQAVASVQVVLSQAFDLLHQAQDSCTKAPGCEFPTWGDRYNALLAVTNRSNDYLAACDDAETSASAALKTPYVYAAGFKQWALDAFGAASDAVTDSTVVSCLMPWWASAVVAITNSVAAAADVLGGILGVGADVVNGAYQAGKAVVNIAKESFSFGAWMIQNFPLLIGGALLFFGGRYAWKHREALKSRFKRSPRLTSGA